MNEPQPPNPEADSKALEIRPNPWEGSGRGEVTTRPESHGIYAKRFPKSYRDHYLEALNDPELHSLNGEIAVLRSLLTRYFDRCDQLTEANRKAAENGADPEQYDRIDPELDVVARVCESIGRNVERVRARSRTLTAKGAEYLAKTLAQVVFEEIGKQDPKLAVRITERLRLVAPRRGDVVTPSKKAG